MKEFEVKKTLIGIFQTKPDGFISGEYISRKLGTSRASVWKYIKKLRDESYIIEAVPNRGYRLKSSPDKMHGFTVDSGLKTKIFGKKNIHCFDNITSTNNIAYGLAENGEEEGALVIAESQTHGKGRLGRKWASPKGGGLYVSLICRPKVEPGEISAITIISAVAAVRAIKKITALDAMVKWPNDVLIRGKKVCGILTEIKAQPDMVDFLISGIGININTPLEKLPPEAMSLKALSGKHIDRTVFLRCLLEEFEDVYLRFQKGKFAALRGECKALSMVLGSRVKIDEHRGVLEGIAEDIDEKGALIIRTDAGEMRRVFSGDVVLSRGTE